MQPKKPAHPPTQVPPADPTHEKLLAVLSQAAQLPDTGSEGVLLLLQIPHLLTLEGRRGRQPWHRPMTGLPDRPQAVGPRHSSASHKGLFTIVLRKTARKSIYHRRVHLHTQRSALSSEPEKRLNTPLPHSSMGPHSERNSLTALLSYHTSRT